MMITVTVSDEIVREAQNRNMQVTEFVEMLIDKGREVATQRPAVNSAMERIRALRTPSIAPRR